MASDDRTTAAEAEGAGRDFIRDIVAGDLGAGKTAQLGARLEPFGVPILALDFPGAPDGIGGQVPGLARAFGKETSNRILSNVIRFTYDGKNLPSQMKALRPRFALEAVPEILDVKKAHYEILRASFKDIEIRSVTSGFPSAELGVGVDEGRELIHELVAITPGWTHPGTDYLASFPPFNLQPTQYRISVDGRQSWFGQ